MAYLKYEEIRQLARGHWPGIFRTLAPQLQDALEKAPRHVPCPIHGGQDGFRLHKDYVENGGAVCNTCGAFPSGFRVLQWLTGWDFPQTLGAVSELLGLGNGIPVPMPAPAIKNAANASAQKQADEKIRQRLQQTWKEAVSLKDEGAKPARLYLMRRGISPATMDSTRCKCHPNLAYFEPGRGVVGRYPALLTMLCNYEGQAVTIHRTYLTLEGFKAPVENPKKTMTYPSFRKLAGALARLGETENGTIGLAEGIETALAVREATGLACWAATSAALLEAAVLPQTINQVVVWADNDRKKAGQMAALHLAARLVKEGRKVKVQVPERPEDKKSWDWNDVLQQQGLGGFPKP